MELDELLCQIRDINNESYVQQRELTKDINGQIRMNTNEIRNEIRLATNEITKVLTWGFIGIALTLYVINAFL